MKGSTTLPRLVRSRDFYMLLGIKKGKHERGEICRKLLGAINFLFDLFFTMRCMLVGP